MPQPLDSNCVNHPDRAAVEHCEVCNKPLCSYCLYYTDDGQRLCETHAREAHSRGLGFNPPDKYADGLLASQAEATEALLDAKESKLNPRVKPKGAVSGPLILYQANNTDLIAYTSMLIGIFTIASICGICSGGSCLPLAGVVGSIYALFTAKDAAHPRRTRIQSIIGLVSSGAIFLFFVGIIAFWIWSASQVNSSFQNQNIINQTPIQINTATPLPTRTRAPIETLTPTPDGESDLEVEFYITSD